MYTPRSCSSISSLRTGRPFVVGFWARARIWSGVVSVTGCSPFVRVDDEAGQGLGVEVGRLLGHHGARPGDRLDGLDRRRVEQEGRVGAVGCGVDEAERLRGRLRVADPTAALDGRRVQAGGMFE